MTGPSGLRPIESLAERQKCPDSPTKRKYLTTDEAWDAAHRNSEQAGVPIAPYACAGCGHYHLSRKVTGSDVLTRQAGSKVLTGAQRRKMANHPALAPVVARVTLPEPEDDTPILPGNQAARRKMLRAFLEDNPTPSTPEVAVALSVSRPTAQADLLAVGAVRDTPKGRWHLATPSSAEAVERQDEPDIEPYAWRDLDLHAIGHLAVGDVLAVLKAAGYSEVRFQTANPD